MELGRPRLGLLMGPQDTPHTGGAFPLGKGRDRVRGKFASALVCGAFLPPHPSPLPEERENRPPRFRQSRAPRLVAARNAVFLLPAGGLGRGETRAKMPLLSPPLS